MLRSVLVATLVWACVAVGCAHKGVPNAAEPAAKRLYTVGEARFAAGYPEEAVMLWRHAITQLPPTDAYDGLRHVLVLRLAYGQLTAYHKLGELAHLYDARRMLDRYLARHEDLFGDGAKAKTERGEVYEILYEVESRIDAPPVVASTADGTQSAARGSEAVTAPGSAASADRAMPGALAVAEPAAPTSPKPSSKPSSTSKSRAASTAKSKRRGRVNDIDGPQGNDRLVIVHTRPRPSVDDPELVRRLAAWDPEAGQQLTAPGLQPWIPARAYVRIDGLARRVDDGGGRGAHVLASRVIKSLRPALRACYDGAFARAPAEYHRAEVEFAVDADGSVQTPRLVGGMVGDALGDACVLERLGDGQIAHDDEIEPMRVTVGLLFFYDGPVMFDEGGGGSVRNELDLFVGAVSAGARARGGSEEEEFWSGTARPTRRSQ